MGATFDNIGAGLIELGRLDSAEHYLARARRMALSAGDLRVQAAVTGRLADLASERGKINEARTGYLTSMALKGRIGDDRGVAADLNNLGILAQDAGDNDEARRQFEAALANNRAGGRPEVAATNLVNLAGLAAMDGDFGTAIAFYRDALETWRQRGDDAEVAVALFGLGQLEMRRGDYPAARRVLLEASTLSDRTAAVEDRILVRRALAMCLRLPATCREPSMSSMAHRDSRIAMTGHRGPVRRSRLLGADLALRMNALADADHWYAESARHARLGNDPRAQVEAQQGRGLMALAMEDEPRATAVLTQVLRSQRAASNTRGAALTRVALGEAAWIRKDTAVARRQLAQAVADLEKIQDPVACRGSARGRGEGRARCRSAGIAEVLLSGRPRRLDARQSPETTWRLRPGSDWCFAPAVTARCCPASFARPSMRWTFRLAHSRSQSDGRPSIGQMGDLRPACPRRTCSRTRERCIRGERASASPRDA
jgi:tetratricopeptide (TPR) repeat protein